MPTLDSIDLDKVALDRLARIRWQPVYCNIVRLDTCERHARSVWDFNTQDTDEFGDRFPKSLPCSKEEPMFGVSVYIQGVMSKASMENVATQCTRPEHVCTNVYAPCESTTCGEGL